MEDSGIIDQDITTAMVPFDKANQRADAGFIGERHFFVLELNMI